MRSQSSIILILLTLFVVFPAYSAMQSPQQLIESVASQTLERIKKDADVIKQNPKHVHSLVNELVVPHFNFERMSRWVLGKYWRKAKPDQKQQFTAEFKQLLIRTYATSLSSYTDQKIKYLPFRAKSGADEVTVRSEVEQPGGFPIPINYRLHKKTSGWKVHDITIDDISLIANYRTSFARQIRKSGINELIKTLARKNK